MSELQWALRGVSELNGVSILATDGAIGSVYEAYFDDARWAIRYLVVDTGRWLHGRQVLISPVAVRAIDWPHRWIALSLNRRQVELSPDISEDRPVSRQHELAFHEYNSLLPYWNGIGLWGPLPTPGELMIAPAEETPSPNVSRSDPHLRSTREVLSYDLQAAGEVIGRVVDFLFDDVTWEIVYMVVDTGTWWSGKKVLVSPRWIARVNWQDKMVHLDLSLDTIRHAPDWDPRLPISREYERRLRGYYGECIPSGR